MRERPTERNGEAGDERAARLCLVGPMVGRNAGRVTTQGEVLTDLFAAAGYPVLSVSSAPSRYVRPLEVVATLLRRRRWIDTLIVETYSGPSFLIADAATALGRRFGHRVILHLHGGALPEFMAAHPSWARRVLRRADRIVAPSGYLASAVEPHGFRATVIPNVIDLSRYRFRERGPVRPTLFWMRSFHSLYNPGMALRALARIRERHPSATLVMAGQDKGLLEPMRREAGRLGLDGAVRFPGFLDAASKAAEGEAADIFISTNRVDNTPVAILEAAAWGLPVIATGVGGVGHLLRHEETGLLVGDDDDEGLAMAVLRLLDDALLARRLSRNGRRLAADSAAPRVLAHWQGLLGRRALGPPAPGRTHPAHPPPTTAA